MQVKTRTARWTSGVEEVSVSANGATITEDIDTRESRQLSDEMLCASYALHKHTEESDVDWVIRIMDYFLSDSEKEDVADKLNVAK